MRAQELSSIVSRRLKEEHQDIYYFMVAMFEHSDILGMMNCFQEIRDKILEAKILYIVILFIINDPAGKMYLNFTNADFGKTICYYSFDENVFYGIEIKDDSMDVSEVAEIREGLVNFKGGSIFDMFGKEYV